MEASLGVDIGQNLSLLSHVFIGAAVPVVPGVVQALPHCIPVVLPPLLTVSTITAVQLLPLLSLISLPSLQQLHIVVLGTTGVRGLAEAAADN